MWKLRTLVFMVVLGTLVLFGSAVAYAAHDDIAMGWGWWWNASVEIEDIDVRPHWTVLGEDGHAIDGEAESYFTSIRIKLPDEADAAVIEQALTERVFLRGSRKLECKSDGIEIEVTYRVRAIEPVEGIMVAVELTADDVHVASATGRLNKKIKLRVLIPADEPDCAD